MNRKILLDEKDIPRQWYNLATDLPKINSGFFCEGPLFFVFRPIWGMKVPFFVKKTIFLLN